MKIYVTYTWFRDRYNYDTVSRTTTLTTDDKSKRGVAKAIREWARGWHGKGYVDVWDISTTFADDMKFCGIAQTRFRFNNSKGRTEP